MTPRRMNPRRPTKRPQKSSAGRHEDSGLQGLCGIAAYYRIVASPDQIRRELALHGKTVSCEDLVRAAALIGLKARLIRPIHKQRLAALPSPAIIRTRAGRFEVFGGKTPAGDYRLVDPITRSDRSLPLDQIHEAIDAVILVSRRIGGAGVEPKHFGLRWFLPSIWRYRRPLGHVLVASLFVQIFALATPLFFQVVVDKVLTHSGYETLFVLVGGLVGHRPVRRGAAISAHLCAVAHHQPDRRRTRRSACSAHLLRLPIAYFETRSDRADGGARARARDDPQLPHRAGRCSRRSISSSPSSFIAVLFAYSWTLTLIVLAVDPALPARSRRSFGRCCAELVKEKFNRGAASQQFLVEDDRRRADGQGRRRRADHAARNGRRSSRLM